MNTDPVEVNRHRQQSSSRWATVLGEGTVAAMIDGLVNHTEIIAVKGASYQLKDRDIDRTPPAKNTE